MTRRILLSFCLFLLSITGCGAQSSDLAASVHAGASSTSTAAPEKLNWLIPLDSFRNPQGTLTYGTYPGLPDFLNLFQEGAPWQNALSHINVVALYEQGLYAQYGCEHSDAQHPAVNPNCPPATSSLKTLFSFLKRHHIAVAVIVGGVNSDYPDATTGQHIHYTDSTGHVFSCGYDFSTSQTMEGLGNAVPLADGIATILGSYGVAPDYILMDEPFYFGHVVTKQLDARACAFTVPQLAENVARTVAEFRKYFPNAKFGTEEPFFAIYRDGVADWASDYQQWLQSFRQAAGVPISFVHDDTDFGAPWRNQLPALRSLLTKNGVGYGLIRDGYASESDPLYASASRAVKDYVFTSTAAGYGLTTAAVPVAPPDQNVFQSWVPSPSHALPETDVTSLTFIVDAFFPPAPAAGMDKTARLIYSLYNAAVGDHLYSMSASEGTSGGYRLEGPAFSLFVNAAPSRQAIVRCLNGGDHFLSVASCAVGTLEGPLGYAEMGISTAAPHLLSRCVGGGHHYSTINSASCVGASLTIEGPQGFVP